MKPNMTNPVSRSTYQKVVEENKRLLYDIHILTENKYWFKIERTLVINKWREKFRKDKEFRELLTAHAKQYLKEHPEYDITKNLQKSAK